MCTNKILKNHAAPVQYTLEEIKSMKEVYKNLTEQQSIDPKRIGLRALALITIISKSNVPLASDKYVKLLNALQICGVDSLRLSDNEVDNLMNDKNIVDFIDTFSLCGQDHEDRSILWIKYRNQRFPPETERAYCISRILYWLASHADNKTIHEGVTTIVDLSGEKQPHGYGYGDEHKIKKLHQAFPMRPQTVKLAGARYLIQILLNFVIMVVFAITRSNALKRIKFITLDEAIKSTPIENAPGYIKIGGEIADNNRKEWIRERILCLPIPEL